MLAGAVRLFVHLRVGVIAAGTRSQYEPTNLECLVREVVRIPDTLLLDCIAAPWFLNRERLGSRHVQIRTPNYLSLLPAPFATTTGTSSLRLRPGYSTHVPLTTIRATTARTIPVQDFAHFGVERVGPSPFGTEPAHTGPGSIRVSSPPE